ncbi:MAG: hydantoinase/oxoprolinase family protein, partial [Reyranellales bacterium]
TDVVRLGAPTARVTVSRSADMRYAGQGHEILVDLPDGPFTAASVAELRKRFEAGYRNLFSRVVPGVDVEVTGWILRAEAPAPGRAADLPGVAGEAGKPAALGTRQLFDPMLRDFHSVPVYARTSLKAGATVQGPAIIAEDETTTIITSGFTASLDSSGAICLSSKSVAVQEAAQ